MNRSSSTFPPVSRPTSGSPRQAALAPCSPAGVLAGPIYIVVGLVQALTGRGSTSRATT